MQHMVIFRSAEGKSGYHQAESLDEAVSFVERLRNREGVPEARIFRLHEVPIEFKTYYKVEVGSLQDENPPARDDDDSRSEPDDGELLVAEPAGAGRFGRFNRG